VEMTEKKSSSTYEYCFNKNIGENVMKSLFCQLAAAFLWRVDAFYNRYFGLYLMMLVKKRTFYLNEVCKMK